MNHKDWDINEHATGRFHKDPDTGLDLPIMGSTFQNGLNDREPDGSFVPCDSGVSTVVNGVTHLKMNRGRMGELRFGDSGHANQFLVKIKNKKEIAGKKTGLSFKYTDSNGMEMEHNDGKPRSLFANGIVIESTPYYKGVKMDIIIENPFTAPTEYNFSAKEYGQDYTVIEENGGLTFRGGDLEPIYIGAPYAVDSTGDIGSVTIHYLGIENNLHLFKKVVDEEWLRNAVGWVKIDPDVYIVDGVDGGVLADAFITSLAANNNYGVSTACYVGQSNAYRTLMGVDLSDYSGVTVVSAKFSMYAYVGSPNNVYFYRVLRDWGEGNKNGAPATAGENSWNHYTYPDTWTTAGCGGSGTDREATAQNDSPITYSLQTDFDCKPESVELDVGGKFSIIIEDLTSAALAQIRSVESSISVPYFYMEYTEEAEGNPNLLLMGVG